MLNAKTLTKLLEKTGFEVLGRWDNLINSGGIKLVPEQIEAKLQSKINQRFFIASESDDLLGERVILIIEGENIKISPDVFKKLSKFETPKKIYFIADFSETINGKLKRLETVQKCTKN